MKQIVVTATATYTVPADPLLFDEGLTPEEMAAQELAAVRDDTFFVLSETNVAWSFDVEIVD